MFLMSGDYGGMGAPARKLSAAVDRKADVLAFIERYWLARGISPSINDIVAEFGFSPTRAKQLVHKLALAKMIERTPGAQRGISVPGLMAKLQAAGFKVNPGEHPLQATGFPQGQLPVLPDLEHIPDDFDAGTDDNGTFT